MNALFGDGHVSFNGTTSKALDEELWYPFGKNNDAGPHHDPTSFKMILSLLEP
jgi:hypothetical protein